MTVEQILINLFLNKRITVSTPVLNKPGEFSIVEGILEDIAVDGDEYSGYDFYFKFDDDVKNLGDTVPSTTTYRIDLSDSNINLVE